MTEDTQPAAPRLFLLNRSAVKAFALQVSKEKRGGKFTRVSEQFIDDIEANIDATIRNLANAYGVSVDEYTAPDQEISSFTTGRAQVKLRTMLEVAACKIIQLKVRRHPSIGVTLKA
jgi:hypothetical protein